VWPRKSNGKLDVSKAPFQLLAIVNRTDLHSSGNGEVRFIFGMKPAKTRPEGRFTVIFEYRLPTATPSGTAISRNDWIRSFNDLGKKSFGPDYNASLQAITDRFTRTGSAPARPNGSAISQVRSNELEMDEFGDVWQMREFHLVPNSSGKGFLKLAPVAQTPSDTLDNTSKLANYVKSQRLGILGGFATVPNALIGGQSDETFNPWGFSEGLGVDEEVRKAFAGQTCNGCHNAEAAQIGDFYHLTPLTTDVPGQTVVTGQERLSDFIKLVELPRRRRFVENRLSCGGTHPGCSPGAEPMVPNDFRKP
jgi:hypothetical protein